MKFKHPFQFSKLDKRYHMYICADVFIAQTAKRMGKRSRDSKYTRSARTMTLFVASYLFQWWSFLIYACWLLAATPWIGVMVGSVCFSNLGGVYNLVTYVLMKRQRTARVKDPASTLTPNVNDTAARIGNTAITPASKTDGAAVTPASKTDGAAVTPETKVNDADTSPETEVNDTAITTAMTAMKADVAVEKGPTGVDETNISSNPDETVVTVQATMRDSAATATLETKLRAAAITIRYQ